MAMEKSLMADWVVPEDKKSQKSGSLELKEKMKDNGDGNGIKLIVYELPSEVVQFLETIEEEDAEEYKEEVQAKKADTYIVVEQEKTDWEIVKN